MVQRNVVYREKYGSGYVLFFKLDVGFLGIYLLGFMDYINFFYGILSILNY